MILSWLYATQQITGKGICEVYSRRTNLSRDVSQLQYASVHHRGNQLLGCASVRANVHIYYIYYVFLYYVRTCESIAEILVYAREGEAYRERERERVSERERVRVRVSERERGSERERESE